MEKAIARSTATLDEKVKTLRLVLLKMASNSDEALVLADSLREALLVRKRKRVGLGWLKGRRAA